MRAADRREKTHWLGQAARRLTRSIGLAMVGFAAAAGWTPAKRIGKPPPEWARDLDESSDPPPVVWPTEYEDQDPK